jgi:hypothetical protein
MTEETQPSTASQTIRPWYPPYKSIRPPYPSYCRLYENPSQIRIAVLQPTSNQDSIIECRLETIEFSPEPSESYIALSYAWGDPSDTQDIIVDGATFAATKNLVSALQHLRRGIKSGLELWIDAICMFQSASSCLQN